MLKLESPCSRHVVLLLAACLGLVASTATADPIQLTTPAAKEAYDYEVKMNALHLNLTKEAEAARTLELLEDNTELLDKAMNDRAQDLTTEELGTLEEAELIKINDDGEIKVLPKGRRQLARQTVEVRRQRKKETLKRRGVSDDEAGPTIEILDL